MNMNKKTSTNSKKKTKAQNAFAKKSKQVSKLTKKGMTLPEARAKVFK